MAEILLILTNFINNFHDLIVQITKTFDLNLTDKLLHFWLIGLIGLLIFVTSDMLFKYMSKWSITIVSFIYTFTVLIVLVLGLEIEQALTGRGSMEFSDIISGLWGFIVLSGVYLFCKTIIRLARGKLVNRK